MTHSWQGEVLDKQVCGRAQVMSDGCPLVSIIISASLTSLPPGQLHQLQGIMIINKFLSSLISSGVYIESERGCLHMLLAGTVFPDDNLGSDWQLSPDQVGTH